MLAENADRSLTLSSKPVCIREVRPMKRERLSDKFNRRDVQFYDTYIKGEGVEEVKDAGYTIEIDP
jgi:hypothetical protein